MKSHLGRVVFRVENILLGVAFIYIDCLMEMDERRGLGVVEG